MDDATGNPMSELSETAAEARRASLLQLPLRSRLSDVLRRHWLEIAGHRLVPARSDLDPSRMTAALPNIVIHRVESPDRIIIRLAGTDFYRTYKRDLTGSNYLDLVSPGRRAQASARLTAAVAQPCGLLTTLVYLSKGGTRGRSESFGLPLIGRDGQVDTLIYVNAELGLAADTPPTDESVEALNTDGFTYVDIGARVPASTA